MSTTEIPKVSDKDIISEFLLKAYQGGKLGRNGIVSKVKLLDFYQEFARDINRLKPIQMNLEILLREGGYLATKDTGNVYTITIKKVLDYRNGLLKQFDENQLSIYSKTKKESPKIEPLTSSTLLNVPTLKLRKKLLDYLPSPSVRQAKMQSYSIESLGKISNHFRKFLETKEITTENISFVFDALLQIQDLQIMESFINLTQKHVTVQQTENEFHVKLDNPHMPADMNFETILSVSDQIVFLPCGEINQDWSNEHDPVKYLYHRLNTVKALEKKIYYGFVNRIEGSLVYFSVKKLMTSQKYDIIFRPSRLAVIFQHAALEILRSNKHYQKYLFPSSIVPEIKLNFPISVFNKNVESNAEQKEAVTNIVYGAFNIPYIIFGPPGTGKTCVLVESILQLLRCDSNSRILVTAGSNGACDEIAKRICKALNNDGNMLLRIYAKSFEKNLANIEENLLKFSNLHLKNHFYPCLRTVKQYRIIICTHTVCGKLVQADLSYYQIKFSHVFIDECGSSTEPETLVGIVGTVTEKTKLIISGDPKQLGPIIETEVTANHVLSISLMERLLERPCYSVGANGYYDKSIQIRLIKNYRSHPDILHFSNTLFYNSELQPCASKDITSWCINWYKLPNPKIPIIFNTVFTNSRQDSHSTSVYNYGEINSVLGYVKEILYFGINGRKIKETDIGIISPYKKQYTKIQNELHKRNWEQIEIGSTETFQGKEKPIIIISMVRSETTSVGFLRNPRRLNVLLSRAQALMIIIGNPSTLNSIPDWKYVIDWCSKQNCITNKNAWKNPKSKSSRPKRQSQNNSRIDNPIITQPVTKDEISTPELSTIKISTLTFTSTPTIEKSFELWLKNTAEWRVNNTIQNMNKNNNNLPSLKNDCNTISKNNVLSTIPNTKSIASVNKDEPSCSLTNVPNSGRRQLLSSTNASNNYSERQQMTSSAYLPKENTMQNVNKINNTISKNNDSFDRTAVSNIKQMDHKIYEKPSSNYPISERQQIPTLSNVSTNYPVTQQMLSSYYSANQPYPSYVYASANVQNGYSGVEHLPWRTANLSTPKVNSEKSKKKCIIL